MIIGIGIDIVHVSRMERWVETPGILDRYFHPRELEAVESRGSSKVLSLAARFAAKEAFGKALGTGLRGMRLKDIRVLNNHNGKPEIKVYNTALAAFGKCGGKTIFLSLTHETDNAVAMVVIEGEL